MCKTLGSIPSTTKKKKKKKKSSPTKKGLGLLTLAVNCTVPGAGA
jgi:hypothetical protein